MAKSLSAICAREGCDEAVAYSGAVYCGAACSEQRKEPKVAATPIPPEGDLSSKVKVGDLVRFWASGQTWYLLHDVAKEGEVAEIVELFRRRVVLAHDGGRRSVGPVGRLLECAEILPKVREGSTPTKEPTKEPDDTSSMSCTPQRHPLANIEFGPGIRALDLRPKISEPFKPSVDEWDLLPDVDVRR